MRRKLCMGLMLIGLTLPLASGEAQDIFVYPAQGQTQAQLDKDKYECHTWAVQQTGFDPSRPAPAPSQAYAAPQGNQVLGGAARGAAVGAIGGAIGGNAGKGAAIGAAAGGLIGAMRRNDQMRQQQNYYQQQSYADSAQRDSYNRALAACLQARGYSVN